MKHNTRVDVRTIRTKEHIRHVLEEMIIEKDYPQITISELMHRAKLNRKTFYLHYESISSIFEELADDISEKIITILKSACADTNQTTIHAIIEKYVEIHAQNYELHRQLFCNPSYYFVFDRIQNKTSQYLIYTITSMGNYNLEKLESIVLFLTYGINAVCRNAYIKKGKISNEIAYLSSLLINLELDILN